MPEPAPLLISHLDRRLIADGTLSRWIAEGRIAGAVTDPSRFAHAIASDASYESGFRRLLARGDDAAAIYQGLVLEDVRAALDLFRPLHDRSAGRFGYVSLGIPPGIERDAKRTAHEAERLRHLLDRPNALIAIPGRGSTWKVIDEALGQGMNVDVTNLHDVASVEQCLKTYLRAARRRAAEGAPLDHLLMIARLDEFVGSEEFARIAACASDVFDLADWQELKAQGGRFPQLAGSRPREAATLAGAELLTIIPAERLERSERQDSMPLTADAPNARAEQMLVEAEESFAAWMQLIEAKRERLEQEATTPGQTGRLGAMEEAVHDTLDDLERNGAVRALWKDGAANAAWLNVAKSSRPMLDDLTRFADEIAEEGFSHVLLLGQSHVVAAAEVLRRTNIPIWGHPELLVLDSVVPATVRRFASAIDPKSTLIVVAECGGMMIETMALHAYFSDLMRSRLGDEAGGRFVAITDPGSLLEIEAKAAGFRRIFLNPPGLTPADSALSTPGLIPAALMGLDVAMLLGRAEGAIDSTRPSTPIEQNPGATLGAALGALARAGRTNLTLVCPAPIEAFGMLIEPLVGSRKMGIRPIVGEPLGSPAVYGNDRVFVQIRTVDGRNSAVESALDALADAGHPVITHILADTLDLGAEFFRWQVATALAERMELPESSHNLKPFDAPELLASDSGLTLWAAPSNAKGLQCEGTTDRERFVATLSAYLARVRPGDCVAVVSYFDEREVRDVSLEMIRTALRDVLRVATAIGYASRFRQGAGMVGEGSSGATVLLQLTADEGEDVALPDEPTTLGRVNAVLAHGDMARFGERALRIDLGTDVDRALATLRERLGEALGSMGSS
jgi:transaldolase/glucose-6-phosphate isomerase